MCEAWSCRTSSSAVQSHRCRRRNGSCFPGLCAIGAPWPESEDSFCAYYWFGESAHGSLFISLLMLAALYVAQVTEITYAARLKMTLHPPWNWQMMEPNSHYERSDSPHSVQLRYLHYGFQKKSWNEWKYVKASGRILRKGRCMYEITHVYLSIRVGWGCPFGSSNLRLVSIHHKWNVSMNNFTLKKWNIDFHRHPMLVWMNTPFLLTATVTSFLVRSRNMNYTSASFRESHSLMPRIIPEVSPESRFLPPFEWTNRAVLSPQQRISHPLFKHMRCNGIQMVILATQLSFDSHHVKSSPEKITGL